MAEAEKALNASLSNVRIEIKDDSYTEFSGGLSTASIVKDILTVKTLGI